MCVCARCVCVCVVVCVVVCRACLRLCCLFCVFGVFCVLCVYVWYVCVRVALFRGGLLSVVLLCVVYRVWCELLCVDVLCFLVWFGLVCSLIGLDVT